MALINCYECGKEISDKATSCPHCGAPVNQFEVEEKKVEKKRIEEIEEQDRQTQQKQPREELKRKEASLGNIDRIAAGWGLGVIWIILSLVAFTNTNVISGIIYLIGAAFLLPPVRKRVYEKTKLSISENNRGWIVLGTLLFAVIVSTHQDTLREEEQQQKIAEEQAAIEIEQKEKELKKFKDNKEKILQTIADQIKSKSFKDALPTCNTYMKFGDKNLTTLCRTVKTEITKIEQKEQEERAKKEAAEAVKAKAKEEAELKKSMGSRAWKLHKKHPEWSIEDCKNVAQGRYWIGMSTEMLVASFGRRPDAANPSNFGSGTHWQYCWHGYTPSCFYDQNDDGIIDSYN